ncbi:MAG: glycosyltransferase family 2 protein [Deinococcales bacterium]|nr:glycosyltransferase family 2 protein [Chitinophagaceae bacterium]
MYQNKIIKVVIPAYNEAESIGLVLHDIPAFVDEVIVVNNNSSDTTYNAAKLGGATVLNETRKGYGSACLKGLQYIADTNGCDIVVFIDADYSDHPEEMPMLLEPIVSNNMAMVIGSRAMGNREPGSMTPQQVFGNKLAVFLIKMFFKYQFTDLGPFRAITWQALQQINMVDTNYGWTVEMQVKALKLQLVCTEVPVSYRKRTLGVSKVSGTIKGSLMAGYKIIKTIFKYA